MGMVVDMVLTVAAVTGAAGTIAELQFRIAHIGTAADLTAVIIVSLMHRSGFPGFRSPELNHLGLLLRCFFIRPQPPGHGEQIQHILTGENHIIRQCHQREQIVGEIHHRVAQVKYVDQLQNQVEHRHDPSLDGNDEEDHKLAVRMGGGKQQDQAQVQIIGHVCINRDNRTEELIFFQGGNNLRHNRAEDHGIHIHQDHAGKIVQIKLKSTHTVFHHSSQHVEEVKEDQLQKSAAGLGEYIGDQPPDLALQDRILIEAQQGIQSTATIDHAHDHDQCVAQDDIEHQIGNALIPVAEAEAFETLPKITQQNHLL